MPGERRPLPSPEALGRLPDDRCRALHARLTAAGFVEDALAEAERVAPRQLDAVRLPLVQAWLARRGGAASLLAALLSYEAAVDEGELRRVLGDDALADLLAAGVVARDGAGVVARYRLTPLRGLLVLSDPPHAGPEVAMGPGPTTLLLVDLVPTGAGDVLDVGCGAGTLALVAAARGARRAVGVDLGPRAVALARFNARLNGLRAEFRCGDLLAPVAGERFDLVLSQPPYVVLPPGVEPTTYLHGGPRGDELALRFAAALPEALADGGLALLHFDAPSLPGRTLLARLREAIARPALDALVFTAAGPSPELQAAGYAALQDPTLGPAYREAARRYADHLAASGVGAFLRALVVLRAAGAGPGVSAQLPARLEELTAEGLGRWLRALALASRPDDALLAARVRLHPGARLVEERPLEGGGGARLRVRFERGLATEQELSAASASLLEAFAAPATVAGAADRHAQTCGAERDGELTGRVLAFVRQGLLRGLLEVEDD